ncbi:hypothetical protein Y032_0426g1246 [Ancylostoma ceylanicum]|uniref:Uncharacterized protein n=1 Tax=Ancylostoma ceylanicum TaxID=53326 RepID=A0A016X1T6_9BILA|nr:hypothetical protein Y032_0426g1246 [Ancylostoma ceylanicum]
MIRRVSHEGALLFSTTVADSRALTHAEPVSKRMIPIVNYSEIHDALSLSIKNMSLWAELYELYEPMPYIVSGTILKNLCLASLESLYSETPKSHRKSTANLYKIAPVQKFT